MIYYYLIFFLTAIIAMAGDFKFKKISFIIIAVILILFAGTRIDTDPDFFLYYKNFQYIENTPKDFLDRTMPIEWCIYIIPHFFKLFFYSKLDIIRSSFFMFALLGVTTKLIAIRKYANVFFLSIILYVSNLFIMQEMTTIRAGVASGIFILSLDALDKKKYKTFFIFIILCFLFHSSSVLFILAWLIMRFVKNIKYYYWLIVFSFISAIFKINFLTLLFLDKIFPRVDVYIKAMEWMKEKETNIFNFRALFALIIILIFAFYYKKLKNTQYFESLFKIHIISVSIFFLLSSSAQVFSTRSFELFSVVQFLLYPLIIYIFNDKFKIFGWIVIVFYALLQIYYLIEIADIYKPYKSWFF